MDNLQAFKLAFFNRCAEEGLTVEQIHHRVKTALSRMEKQSAGGSEGTSNAPWNWLTNLSAGTALGNIAGKGDPAWTASGAGLGAMNVPQIASNLITPGILLALAGGTGLGIFGGKYLAESKYDPLAAEEVKAQEIKNEYARLAERARRTAKKRELKGNM